MSRGLVFSSGRVRDHSDYLPSEQYKYGKSVLMHFDKIAAGGSKKEIQIAIDKVSAATHHIPDTISVPDPTRFIEQQKTFDDASKSSNPTRNRMS